MPLVHSVHNIHSSPSLLWQMSSEPSWPSSPQTISGSADDAEQWLTTLPLRAAVPSWGLPPARSPGSHGLELRPQRMSSPGSASGDKASAYRARTVDMGAPTESSLYWREMDRSCTLVNVRPPCKRILASRMQECEAAIRTTSNDRECACDGARLISTVSIRIYARTLHHAGILLPPELRALATRTHHRRR